MCATTFEWSNAVFFVVSKMRDKIAEYVVDAPINLKIV
jgi:hypothetical protein